MVNKNTRKQANKRRKRSLRQAYFLSAFTILVSSIFLYAYSFESKTHFLKSEGNMYYTDQEIFDAAKINSDTRIWLTPNLWIQYHLSKKDMIDNVRVEKNGDALTLQIEEKIGIGYFVEKNETYILTIQNEEIPVSEKELKRVVLLYPMLNGFSKKERERLAQTILSEEDFPCQIFQKISVISPYENSFDKNMVKMQMNDGNTIFCSLRSFHMLPKYEKIVGKLDESYACVFLDGTNNNIVKSDCASFDQEARFLRDAQKRNEIEQSLNTEEEYEFEDTGIYDWEYVEIYNLYYSKSEDIYMYAPTRSYYRLDDSTYSFIQIN